MLRLYTAGNRCGNSTSHDARWTVSGVSGIGTGDWGLGIGDGERGTGERALSFRAERGIAIVPTEGPLYRDDCDSSLRSE